MRRPLALPVAAVMLLALTAQGYAVESLFDSFRQSMGEVDLGRLKRIFHVPVTPAPAPTAKATPATTSAAPESPPTGNTTDQSAVVPIPRLRPGDDDTAESTATAEPPPAVPAPPPRPDTATTGTGTPNPPAAAAAAEPPPTPTPAPAETVELPRPRPDIAMLTPPVPPPSANKPPTTVNLPPQKDENPPNCGQSLATLGINATIMPDIKEGACGITQPVAVASLQNGAVKFSMKAVLNCEMADTLADWMHDQVQPAAKQILGGTVTDLRIADAYTCRGRNGDPAAKLSEHAFGNAIDIAAFQVSGHGWIAVGHASGDEEKFLELVRQESCGPFTTVLGPGVPLHEEHFHLDLARRGKSGRTLYCH